jgi:hypothetical protein
MADNKFIAPADVDVQLQNTAKTYRSQLITMPTKGLAQSLKYMTLRPGIRVSETVGELLGNAELGPYDENRVGDGGVKITPRTLQVYLGNVDIKFSPNSVYSTIWGANAMNGEALKNVPITLQVLQLLALKLGKNLNLHLFDAVRNDEGKGSKDLFNGFDTIAKTELTNGKLSRDLGNLIKVSDILGSGKNISSDNAVDFAQAICEEADEELIGEEKLYLYVPQAFINLYNRNYLNKFGNVPYNTGYNHNTVEGFDNVEMVPLINKKNAPFFQLTTRNNMLVGVNEANNSDEEKISVEKYHPWKLDFIATKFLGCQYESINKERALFITNDGTTSLITKGSGADPASSNTASDAEQKNSSADDTGAEGKE